MINYGLNMLLSIRKLMTLAPCASWLVSMCIFRCTNRNKSFCFQFTCTQDDPLFFFINSAHRPPFIVCLLVMCTATIFVSIVQCTNFLHAILAENPLTLVQYNCTQNIHLLQRNWFCLIKGLYELLILVETT